MSTLIKLLLFLAVGLAAQDMSAQNMPAQNMSGESIETLLRDGKWSRNFTVPGFTGHDGFAPVVYDFARGKDGGVLATGRFQWIGAQRMEALVQSAGEGWRRAKENWGREVPLIGFSSIAVSDSGAMALSTHSGPFGANPSEIWLDSEGGVRTIGHLRGSVRSMVWFKEKLWVGGNFRLDENGSTYLAVWDGTAWSEPPGGPADRPVYRLTISGEKLLLAGNFSTVGGMSTRHIAEWSGTEWKAYDMAPPIRVAHVYAVSRNDRGELFAGGAITGGVVRWTGAGWEPLSGGVALGGFDGVVSDMAMHKGGLYVTGCFSHVNGGATNPSSIRAQSVARWTGDRWESLDDGSRDIASAWFEFEVCGYEPNEYTAWDLRYQRLFSDGDRLLLGGTFAGAGGTPSQSIISYNGEEWKAVGDAKEGLSGSAYVLATGGPADSVYAMGSISNAGQAVRTSGIFRYDRERQPAWQAVGGPLPTGIQCSRLAVDPAGGVFVGCYTPFTPARPPRTVVLRMDGENWVALETPDLQGIPQDLRVDPSGRLWVAGGVRTGDTSGSGFVARLDGDRFTVVENGFDSMVFRIAFRSGGASSSQEMLAAGAFTHIGSNTFERVARWREGGSWEPLGTGLSTGVLALAWAEDAVYVSTETPINPERKQILLGRWDGGQWVDVGTPANGLPAPREKTVHSIRDLLAVGRYVVAVGSVWPESGGRNAFLYDGIRITALSGGLNAIGVSSVVSAGDGLWFGGEIAEAGSGEDRVPSIGIARFGLESAAPQ